MSRKQKTKVQKPNFPWVALALGGLLILVSIFFFTLQAGERSGTPDMRVDAQRIDFGDVKLGTPLTFTVRVTNVGDGTLRFREAPYIEVKEGC
ncbi:MAG: hypothetical protein Kow0088_09700 [Anaerolineales bacterium]